MLLQHIIIIIIGENQIEATRILIKEEIGIYVTGLFIHRYKQLFYKTQKDKFIRKLHQLRRK